jgi:hypothetical protein
LTSIAVRFGFPATILIVIMSHSFGAFIQHESSPVKTLQDPDHALTRDEITARSPSVIELDNLRWGDRLNGPKDERPEPAPIDTTPRTPGELEASPPPTPAPGQAAEAIVQSMSNPPKNRWRLGSVGVMLFLMGMNDAVVSSPKVRAEQPILMSENHRREP